VEFYNTLKEKGKKLEIVFASSDKDQSQFDEYYGEMPWASMPFSDRDAKDKLSKKFKVSGIPTLVVLDGEGKTISTDGRSSVDEDPEGKEFPWHPPTFAEAMGEDLVAKGGASAKWSDLQGKTIALYFSAHWCPPCRGFTPQLVKTYNTLKEQGKDFEVVFVSSDKDQSQFDEYFGEMPWLALPYPDRSRKNKLSKLFGVQGIPSLVILDSDGKVINPSGRGAVGSDPEGKEFPWHPKPVNDIESPDGINETLSLLVLGEKCEEGAMQPITDALTNLAEEIKKEGEDSEKENVLFFTASKSGNIASRVRQMASQGEPLEGKLQALVVSVSEGGYYPFEGDVTPASVVEFVNKVRAGGVELKSFG
jgi:nucleoredoxin